LLRFWSRRAHQLTAPKAEVVARCITLFQQTCHLFPVILFVVLHSKNMPASSSSSSSSMCRPTFPVQARTQSTHDDDCSSRYHALFGVAWILSFGDSLPSSYIYKTLVTENFSRGLSQVLSTLLLKTTSPRDITTLIPSTSCLKNPNQQTPTEEI